MSAKRILDELESSQFELWRPNLRCEALFVFIDEHV